MKLTIKLFSTLSSVSRLVENMFRLVFFLKCNIYLQFSYQPQYPSRALCTTLLLALGPSNLSDFVKSLRSLKSFTSPQAF